MFSEMSAAQTIQMIAVLFVIATVTILLLVLMAVLAPERLFATSEQSTPAWRPGELGAAATFREPADPVEVDRRIAISRTLGMIRGTAPVIHSPAPLPIAAGAVLDMTPLVGARIDELFRVPVSARNPVDGRASTVNPASRYYRPSVAALVDETRQAVIVGRHRARELVAA